MKNRFLTLAFMLIGTFTFANTNDEPKNDISILRPDGISIEKIDNTEDEALHCTVSNGSVTASCWFCNCEALAQKMMK